VTWFDQTKKLLAKWKAQEGGHFPNISVFTPRAQQAMALARKEADRLNHNFLGTGHLLLGIIKLNQGVCINVLRNMHVNLDDLRSEVEKNSPGYPPENTLYGIPYTPRMKRVIALAQTNAQAFSHTYVGTEHFLLGILEDGGGVAAKMLKQFNVDFERARKEILIELEPNFAPPDDGQEAKD
jgi:ATP-dependent Clp protease ATP-binding subunit ClpC